MKRAVPCSLLMAVVLNACGEGPDTAGRDPRAGFCDTALARVDSFMATVARDRPEGPRYGGTAVVGAPAELGGMNAFAHGDAGAVQHQMFVNLMTLVRYDEELEPMPYLARSWEVSEDQSELTFHLRDDVRWHDGRLTTAYDVAFTYMTAVDPRSGFPNPAFFQHYLPEERGVEVVDSFTVRFRLRPHAEFMDPWRTVAIMPRHLLGDVPPEELARHPFGDACPVGNGPYRFVSRSPGDRWVFEANPAFPAELGGGPYLDRYVYRVIPEQTTLLAELLTGGVDVHVAMFPNHARRAESEPGLRVMSFPYRSVLFAGWNSRVQKLSDPRVRRALTLGMNRRQIMVGIHGEEAVLVNSGVPPVHWAFDPTLADSFPYDPDRARDLLEAAGWADRDGDGIREDPEGTPLRIELIMNQNQERQEVAEIITVQLREIGVDLRPRVLEFATLMGRITSPQRDFEGVLVSWEAEFRLDERDLFHSEVVDGLWAFSGTMDPVLDRYLDTLQLAVERTSAIPIWHAYQRRLMEVHPFTYLYSSYRRNGVADRLRDVVMDARGEWAGIRDWWIAPEDRRVP
jgi:peptide/nickel transport system substrate-binding protein